MVTTIEELARSSRRPEWDYIPSEVQAPPKARRSPLYAGASLLAGSELPRSAAAPPPHHDYRTQGTGGTVLAASLGAPAQDTPRTRSLAERDRPAPPAPSI